MVKLRVMSGQRKLSQASEQDWLTVPASVHKTARLQSFDHLPLVKGVSRPFVVTDVTEACFAQWHGRCDAWLANEGGTLLLPMHP